MAKDLVDVMREAAQDISPELEAMARSGGGYGGGGSSRYGGGGGGRW